MLRRSKATHVPSYSSTQIAPSTWNPAATYHLPYPVTSPYISDKDELICNIVKQIDKKSLSDYEFRAWLRDNLSSCQYHSAEGTFQYQKPDDKIQKMSVLDIMFEQGKSK